MMHKMLKTADPTMVPTPTSPLVMKTPGDGVTHKHTHMQHQAFTESSDEGLLADIYGCSPAAAKTGSILIISFLTRLI